MCLVVHKISLAQICCDLSAKYDKNINTDYEHDQLRVSILSIHDNEYYYMKDFHYHARQSLREICFFKDFQGAEVHGPNHF